MNDCMRLDELLPGQCALVLSLENEESMRRRLRDMGMIEGTVVECVGISPCRDPVCYRFRGTTVALRRRDGRSIRVRLVNEA